ncbi:MAG: transcriptional repressor [Paludibacteraceae bacterium]|nr:transcriptional repressor [Paludibacteraceae bacterium]
MQNNEKYHEVEQILMEYQGLHHLRNTPERLKILHQIVDHTGAFSAADVQKWVKDDFISPATVYNTLALLEKARIVHCLRKQHSSRTLQYELAVGEQCTMQIVCTRCGRVSMVKDKSAETALKMKNYPNFIMQHYSVYVFGECKHCKK